MAAKPFVLTLDNIYDYAEYKAKALAAGREVYSWGLYVQIVETLLKGMETYPEMEPMEAYYKFISENGNMMYVPDRIAAPAQFREVNYVKGSPAVMPVNNTKAPCGGCGGGQVR